ncbi:M1 family aminopeptidase [Luedemannella flava]
MENAGLVTFRDEYVFRAAVTDTEREQRAMIIAHEMAHMWFGDLVTMRWWDDLWLNESFAEYLGYRVTSEATQYTSTWVNFALGRKAWGYRTDQRSSTHPIAPDRVEDTEHALMNFDGISYAKGASVLRQLVAWLGDDAFFEGCASTSRPTRTATRPSPTCSPHFPRAAAATSTNGRGCGCAKPRSTRCGRSWSWPRRHLRLRRGGPDRPRQPPHAAPPPHRRRGVRGSGRRGRPRRGAPVGRRDPA